MSIGQLRQNGIEAADWHDILQVLHETYRIWSPGLSPLMYRERVYRQLSHPWGRKHMRFAVYKRNGQILSSCKLYEHEIIVRGQIFRALGIGAVYTMEKHRGTGCATTLIERVIDAAGEEGFDCLTLYSEIGAEFYEHFGFEQLGSAEFNLSISGNDLRDDEHQRSRFVQLSDIDFLERHYARWLRQQPYGVVRNHSYWDYKLKSEQFLELYSKLSWPELELLCDEEASGGSAYAIIEQGGSTLRVLEIIGGAEGRFNLWQQILRRAVAVGAQRIRGREGLMRDFAPGFSVRSVVPPEHQALFAQVHYTERDWGVAMMLPLVPELDWLHVEFPCPLLELDHF
jgi:GNAT superfamily N-acetyltransferase